MTLKTDLFKLPSNKKTCLIIIEKETERLNSQKKSSASNSKIVINEN